MRKVGRWLFFAAGAVIILLIATGWRGIDRDVGGGLLSGALRGAFLVGAVILLWRLCAPLGSGKSIATEAPDAHSIGPANRYSNGTGVGAVPIDAKGDHSQVAPVRDRDSPSTTEFNEREAFTIIANELDDNQMDKGLWLKAFVCSDGNATQQRIFYVDARLRELRAAHNEQARTVAGQPSGKRVEDPLAVSEEENKQTDPASSTAKGRCPSCKSIIPLSSTECPNCPAVFDHGDSWKVLPISET